MPQGERRGVDVDLHDAMYDGKLADGYLSGGLGQLTDGTEGQSNFRLDSDNSGKKGYEWIGWKNDTVDRPPIQVSTRRIPHLTALYQCLHVKHNRENERIFVNIIFKLLKFRFVHD